MAGTYRVTAPYVTLKVLDTVSGAAQINGFYAGAIVTESRIDSESLKRHVDRGWVEEVDEPAAEPTPEPKTPEKPASNPDKVPDGTADEVKAWVGDDAEKAKLALAAEQKIPSPRKTLVDHLAKVASQAKTEK